MKSVLVTGGLGYIGSHLSLRLLEEGYKVFVIDSLVNSSYETLNKIHSLISLEKKAPGKKLNFFQVDIRGIELIEKVFHKIYSNGGHLDGVIHLAGLKSVKESVLKPLDYWNTNVVGSLNLLKVMKKFNCYTILFSSSATIYGNLGKCPFREDHDIKPINPYGMSKATVENMLKDTYNSEPDKWGVASLRYFNPIGSHPSGLIGENPKNSPNNIFPLISRVASKKIDKLRIFGNNWNTIDGTGVRDYIHVMDLAEGHIKTLDYLLKSKGMNIALNIGTGKGTSVLELVRIFEKTNNVKVPYVFTERREGDVGIAIADNDLATSVLKWCPSRKIDDMCRDGWKSETLQN